MEAVLESTAAQHQGRKLVMDWRPVTIGRVTGCDLQFAAETRGISRQHCCVTWNPDEEVFYVEDLDSSYGTFLMSGERMEPHRQYCLKPGESFYLAGRENTILLTVQQEVIETNGPKPENNSVVHTNSEEKKEEAKSEQPAASTDPSSNQVKKPSVSVQNVKSALNEIKQYLRPTYTYLVIGVFFLSIGIYSLTLGEPTGALVCIILAAIFSLGTVFIIRGYNDQIKKLREEEKTASLVKDFLNAETFFDDTLRIGESYIFGKRSGKILEPRNIVKAYQYIHKTNFAEDRRRLRVDTADGKTVDIGRLKLRGKSDEELLRALALLTTRNPDIRIGYKS